MKNNFHLNSVKCFGIIFILFLSLHFCSSTTDQPGETTDQSQMIKNWAYQLQNADPDQISNSGFELVVIDYSSNGEQGSEYSPEDIAVIKNMEKTPVVYISIGEAEEYRFYWKKEWKNSPPEWLGDENPEWEGNYKVKFWEQGWKDIVFEYLDKVILQGFSGVYLDIVDAFEYWGDDEIKKDLNLKEEDAAGRMILFIKEISDYCRAKSGKGFLIIPQNGERIIDYDKNSDFINSISGIGIEDLFYNESKIIKNNEMKFRAGFLDRIQNNGKLVLTVDYVDDGSGYSGKNRDRIDDFFKKCKEKGYLPYAAISDRSLDELNIISGIQPDG